jgi:putative transposase
MPRKKRFFHENGFHHIMLRGVNGEAVFLDDRDRARFCLLMQEGCEKHGLTIHGFCLMTNHVHLILLPKKDSFQAGIHAFSFRYAQYFNRRHKRRGYLFQGRFKSILVEEGVYLKRLIRYIHLNPLEGGIVQRPEHFKWSSFRGYLDQDHYVWLETDSILRRFGEFREVAIKQFIDYTLQKVDASLDKELILKSIRKGAFGSNDFLVSINLNNVEYSLKYVENEFSLSDLVEHICGQFNVTFEDLVSSNKQKAVIAARSVLALIVRKTKKWSLEKLAHMLNKNSGTISRLASTAEQKPDLLAIVNNWNPSCIIK